MPAMLLGIFFNPLMQPVIIPAKGEKNALVLFRHGLQETLERVSLFFKRLSRSDSPPGPRINNRVEGAEKSMNQRKIRCANFNGFCNKTPLTERGPMLMSIGSTRCHQRPKG